VLTHPDPYQRPPFESPGGGGPASVQGEGHGQGEEGDAEGEEGFGQQFQPLPLPQAPGQQQIDRTHRQRTVGKGEGDVVHQCGLQSETAHRYAEHQAAIHIVFQ